MLTQRRDAINISQATALGAIAPVIASRQIRLLETATLLNKNAMQNTTHKYIYSNLQWEPLPRITTGENITNILKSATMESFGIII